MKQNFYQLLHINLHCAYFIISASTADAISALQIRMLQSSDSEYPRKLILPYHKIFSSKTANRCVTCSFLETAAPAVSSISIYDCCFFCRSSSSCNLVVIKILHPLKSIFGMRNKNFLYFHLRKIRRTNDNGFSCTHAVLNKIRFAVVDGIEF